MPLVFSEKIEQITEINNPKGIEKSIGIKMLKFMEKIVAICKISSRKMIVTIGKTIGLSFIFNFCCFNVESKINLRFEILFTFKHNYTIFFAIKQRHLSQLNVKKFVENDSLKKLDKKMTKTSLQTVSDAL